MKILVLQRVHQPMVACPPDLSPVQAELEEL